MRSTVWLLLPLLGFCLAVMLNGSNVTATASRKAVCLNQRVIALRLPEQIGEDGQNLLTAVFDPLTPIWLRELPAIQVLRRIWVQNYFVEEDGQLRWRETGNLPPATVFINSPYDPDAHLGKKRTPLWTGYKIHLTETCEQTLPHLITHVATTAAPKTDEAMTERMQQELRETDLFPAEHFVDAG